ncbi:MAG TPA: TetR/AcrR family transcriptional regulator [Streptosporangiaceae bacterium]|jgi:AcrR family transcriptional regulator
MGNETETGLPASIELAWGRRERPTKGPKRGLSLERIVEAGVDVAVAEGLGAVSIGRVAKELGAAPMALYRYIGAKDELLALMLDAACGRPPEPAGSGDGWRAGLAAWAWALLGVWRRHPWGLAVPLNGLPLTPNQIAWMEAGLACMRETGLDPRAKLSVMLLIMGFVRNDATMNVQLAEATKRKPAQRPETVADYGRVLALLIDDERFPELSAVLDARVMDSDAPPDDEFTFGLDRLLDGVAALIDGTG